jgi:large subunit ribosomal protein L14
MSIYVGTKLKSADNTDIKKVKCIKIFPNSNKKFSFLGDIVRILIVRRRFKKTIIKKKLYLGLIITIKKTSFRLNGIFLKFDQNRSLTLSEDLKFLGTRVYGPIAKEVRNSKKKKTLFKKIISYSKATV